VLDFDNRPWGRWEEYLNEETYRLKRIIVNPGKRLSLQWHRYRSEHWVVVKGQGVITLGSEDRPIKQGDTFVIPIEVIHRVSNTGSDDLVIIETQMGKCDENDIVRIEDDWNRT